ncbi:MAG: DEAD/DEAH box helicase [Dehalococcoidia bacterium]
MEVHVIPSDTLAPRRRRRSRSSTSTRAEDQLQCQTGLATTGSPARLEPAAIQTNQTDVSAFRALGLSEATLSAVAAMGFTTPTPIQEQATPWLLQGRDVVGRAQTGTGKTLAFAAAIAERLDPRQRAVQAIVMVPTRELAMQVAAETERICNGRGLEVVALFGGRRVRGDMAALQAGPQVIVGTPGRVIDHLRRGTLQLGTVKIVVLDEADEMLDIGFADDIETILRRTPKARQTGLFSATLPPFIRRMIVRYLVNPAYVSITPSETTVAAIDQVYYEVSERDKLKGMLELLRGEETPRVLCFRNTQAGVDRLAAQLQRNQVAALGIHGGMSQPERDRVMQAFRAGELRVLIATNVAARGLDIPEVTHVINFDLPQNTEEYVHRTGRTGRAGRTGIAVTFIGEWDYPGLDVLKRFVGDTLRREQFSFYG